MPYSFDKRTHTSKGKADKIPHPVGASPHSGTRKNKLRKALEAREDKIRIPVIKGPRRTKRKPTKKEQEMDRRLQLQELTPNIHKIIEESQKAGGGKVKGYKKGGSITYRMAGGQVVDNSYD